MRLKNYLDSVKRLIVRREVCFYHEGHEGNHEEHEEKKIIRIMGLVFCLDRACNFCRSYLISFLPQRAQRTTEEKKKK